MGSTTFHKREKEAKRRDKAREKEARRHDKPARPTREAGDGEDPDLAGIIPGPQPIPED